jgi:hypothetical protein
MTLKSTSLAWLLLVAACSLSNREGPDVSCKDLGSGTKNACAEGIIASCESSKVTYRVCDDNDACEATWQQEGAFRCSQGDSLPELEPSKKPTNSAEDHDSNSDAGSDETFKACGWSFGDKACASCFQDGCCDLAKQCADDEECTSCVDRPGSAAPCAFGIVPVYDEIQQCLGLCDCQ